VTDELHEIFSEVCVGIVFKLCLEHEVCSDVTLFVLKTNTVNNYIINYVIF
jgi:hypothetical protein